MCIIKSDGMLVCETNNAFTSFVVVEQLGCWSALLSSFIGDSCPRLFGPVGVGDDLLSFFVFVGLAGCGVRG